MQENTNSRHEKRILYEVLLVMGLTFILSLLLPAMKGIINFIPLIYLLIERRKRGREWSELGFRLKNTLKDLKKSWHLALLVAVVTQILTLLVGKYYLPGFVEHIQSRVPLMDPSNLIPVILVILLGTFLEELMFRGLFQERLGWYMSAPLAVIISSTIFAVSHYSEGALSIVLFDIATIFIDSIIYGTIYHRTKNIFASWIPHCLADLVGIALMVYILAG